MKKNIKPESLDLRQKAEERLKNKFTKVGTKLSEAEVLSLIHELEVHQVELEMQNEELILAKEQATLASEKYIKLYDSAPSGYFTLSPKGEILQLNLAGAAMLGKTQAQLKNRLFHVFVTDNSKPFFLLFLEKIFNRHEKETCELTLLSNNEIPKYAYITGIVSENGDNCLITVIDITERNLLESNVVEKMILQRETEKAGKIGGWSFNVKTLIQNWTQETFNILEIEPANGEPKVPESIQFIDEPFRQSAEIAIKRAIQFGEPFEQEWKVTTAKGNKRWVNTVGKTKIVKGKTIGLFGSIQDITVRKQTEEALQASEEKYHAIFNNVQDVFYQTDLAGTVLEVSPSIKHFSDFNRDEIIGKPVTKLYYDPNDRAELIDLLKKKGEFSDYELRLKTRTGELRYVSNNARLVFDSDGKPHHIDGEIKDITQHKLAEIELKESQLLLKASIESPKDMIILSIDKDYKYLNFNTYHKNVMLNAYGKDIKLGMNLLDCISNEDDRIKAKTNYDRALNGESHTTIEEYGELNRFYYETRYNPILNDNNEVIGATAFSSNITERKLAEKQIQRLNRVYSILSNINQTIVRNHDKELLFDEVCRITVDDGGFKMAWIGMVNPTTNKIDIVASTHKAGDFLNSINIDLNNTILSSGPAGQAIKSGKSSFSNNIETDDKTYYWRKIAHEYGYRSVIALPVIVWGKTIGVYIIYSGEIDFFNEDEIKLLEEMASDISFAIEFIESDKDRKQAEEALKENNLRLELAMQAANMAWWEMDITTGNVIFDKRKSDMIGYPAQKFKHYTDFVALVHPEDSDKAMNAMRNHINGLAEKYEIEYRILSKSGEYKWFYDIGAVVKKDTNGIPLYVTGLVMDISSRKLAEQALHASELKYHNIFNNVQDVFYQTNLAGTVLEVSPSIKNFSGFNRDEIVGKPVTNLYYDPNDRIKILDLLKEKGELRDYELCLKSVNGEIKYTSINARLVFDSEGKPNHIDGAIRDITERKLMREKLKQSEERFQLAMKASKDGLFDWNLETNEIYYAPGWKKIIGYKDHELLNDFSIWEETTDPLDVKKSWELHQKLITKQIDRFVLEFKMKHKDGHWVDILSRAKAIFNNDGKAIRIVGTHTDISEPKKAEKALRESTRILLESQAVANIGAYVTELTATEFEANAWKATPEIYKIFGIDETYPHTLAGWVGFIHPNSREELFAYHYQVVAERKRFDHEYKIIRINDGAERWVHGTGELEFDNQHNPIRMLGTIQDITERKFTEEALRKSEAIQQKIVSNIGDVIVIIDQNGINRYKSPNIETLFGWKPEELVGKSAWDLVHPDDLESSQKIVAEVALIPNATETTEIRYMRKDGEYAWIEITLVNLLYDHDIQGILGNYHDISERRLAQEKNREKDNEFRKLSSNLPDLIFQFTRRPDGTYYVPIASEGIKNIFGCSPEDVINDFTPIGRVIHPDDVERVIADIEYSAKHLSFFTCEFRVQIPGKPIQWIYSKSTPEKLPDGSITWYGFNADITERKRVEDSLVKLKTAINKSEISVVITDRNGIIEYANPFFSKLTGYSPEEYIGKNPRILKSEYHTKEFYQEMWNKINSGETWEGEFYNCNKNGEMYWENAIISPITNSNNEITNFVAIKTDITDAKKISSELIIAKERAEESDRLKSAFLANMSHEIRTPMNGIIGFTELLKEPDISDDQQKYFISIIEKSGERLLNIINDIIDISKIESGLMKVENSEINVNEYLDQVLVFFNPEADAKNIKLICSPGLQKKEAFLKTDSEKFHAILTNLVKNALKYTKTGFIEFGYIRQPNHSYLQFYVKDTGIGIPKDRQEAIFERFVQADIVDKMARQGAGLGLSISKAYVEMLRGSIWVESEVENLSSGKSGSSTFYFTLPYNSKPLELSNVGIEILIPVNEIHINPEVSGLKILIAEDDESSSQLISIHIRKFGTDVIKVQNGREAVEACRNNPDIDLVLMDIQMPELNGYDATQQIRQFNTEVTIIALTAFALAGDREKAIKAGCNDYISKPVKMTELGEMIQKYFKS